MTSLEPNPLFCVAVERRGETLVATPSGELDVATVPQLAAALREHDGFARLLIDLRPLSFMDSSGLRLLVAEHDRAQRGGYELALVRGGAEVDRLLRVTRLDERLPLGEADALGL
ncbi:STAS domain-containing protein [Conexibacter woesei]|uniref:Anti-sigma factor antagonist n=1 Tax=Conexibacter woesei (strain DSM 14684 / CCUG 47730 / CIP 108061 / JCM 11494 / NBRC 100937 / ID131577) TaxID=469383 RepID=D3EZ87_CONWI|nr:STAS domain-containing protein [Conexibacter woesei]ADB51852.1 anti-sigma-factor antagonist [Conexibacter woesei DSM 14684]